MSVASLGLTGSRGRSVRVGAGLGSLTTAAVVLLLVVLLPSGPSASQVRSSRRAAVTAWEARVRPLVDSAGQVVALGPRYAAGRIARHELAPAQAHAMAAGWTRRLTTLGAQLAAVPTPGFLHPVHDLLGQAMTGYVTASRRLLEAADAAGARQQHLLDEAVAAGKAADHTYDRAAAALARWRAQLGLPTDWSG